MLTGYVTISKNYYCLYKLGMHFRYFKYFQQTFSLFMIWFFSAMSSVIDRLFFSAWDTVVRACIGRRCW